MTTVDQNERDQAAEVGVDDELACRIKVSLFEGRSAEPEAIRVPVRSISLNLPSGKRLEKGGCNFVLSPSVASVRVTRSLPPHSPKRRTIVFLLTTAHSGSVDPFLA